MTTHRSDVDDDVIPEVDFSRGIPNPFAGSIGPNYRIVSRGNGPDRTVHSVISRPGRRHEWIEFLDLPISPRRAVRFATERVARDAIAEFLGVDAWSFDLSIEVRGAGSRGTPSRPLAM